MVQNINESNMTQAMDKETALENITAIILGMLEDRDHMVGRAYPDDYDSYESNAFTYDEDGWFVDFGYDLCGAWVVRRQTYYEPGYEYFSKIRGRVYDLVVTYDNDETGEHYAYTADELKGLKGKIMDTIKDCLMPY